MCFHQVQHVYKGYFYSHVSYICLLLNHLNLYIGPKFINNRTPNQQLKKQHIPKTYFPKKMQLPTRSTTASTAQTHQPQPSLPYRPSHLESSTPASLQHQDQDQHPNNPPQPQNPVYIIRLLEGWRQTPTAPVMNVEILGVFATAERANAYTRRWLAARLPRACYRYGEGEVRRGDGGIRVDVVTERRDGSLLVDVERHFVVCGGGGEEEEGV